MGRGVLILLLDRRLSKEHFVYGDDEGGKIGMINILGRENERYIFQR